MVAEIFLLFIFMFLGLIVCIFGVLWRIIRLPFALIFAAYGISTMQKKHKQWFNYWIMFIFIVNIAWAWFKLKGRGM